MIREEIYIDSLFSICITVAAIVIIKYLFDVLSPDGHLKSYINLVISILFTLLIITRILNIDTTEMFNTDIHMYYDNYVIDYTNDYNDILSRKFSENIKRDAEKYIRDKYNIKTKCTVTIETDIQKNILRISQINIECNYTDVEVKKLIADDIADRYKTEVTII